MSDFEDKLNSILSSPEQMEKILSMARQVSEGEEQGGARSRQEPKNGETAEMDPKLLQAVTRILHAYAAHPNAKLEVVNAIRPYLRPERQKAMDRAMELTKLAGIARIALAELSGGDGHV